MSNSNVAHIPVDIVEIETMLYSIADMSGDLLAAFCAKLDTVLNSDPSRTPGDNAIGWLFDNYGTVAAGLRLMESVSSLICSAITNDCIAIVPRELETK